MWFGQLPGYLTLGAHAQRGLQYLLYGYVYACNMLYCSYCFAEPV